LKIAAVPRLKGVRLVVSVLQIHLAIADDGGGGDFLDSPVSLALSRSAIGCNTNLQLRRIMIVDDMDDFREATALWIFHRYLAQVDQAECGGMALDIMTEGEQIDLVLLDIKMPEQDGFEVCKSMRAKGFAAPVIFMSADDSLENRENAKRLGCVFLPKPLDYGRLELEILKFHGNKLS
jgi:CheY-like chemotaxis protein